MNLLMKKITTLFLLIPLLFISSSCSSKSNISAPVTLQKFQEQKVTWKKCYDSYLCTTIKVPIDYNSIPTGSLDISVLKAPATKKSARIGALVVNPGGPGGSGVDYAYNADYIVSREIRSAYDIVGFDPRGVSRSAPIKCLTDKETDQNYASDSKPDNAKELASLIEDSKKYFSKCLSKTKYLNQYSTANAARDMDILRAVLGERKLNYLGKSYGTYMGTLYAQLFPKTVGRFILDGAIDPNVPIAEQNLNQAIGFDQALSSFIKNCLTLSNCPLPKTITEARQYFIDLLSKTSKTPLPSSSNRAVTETLVLIGTASALYDNESGWPILRSAIREANRNNGDAFLELADAYAQRNPDGTYADNENDASVVIDCLDWKDSRTLDEIQADENKFAKQAPVFGPYLAYSSLSCKYFPQSTSTINTGSVMIDTEIKISPILIIGTLRDPATPYKWAQGLHKIFKGSILVSLDADGHTGHGRGSQCVDDAVDAYLLVGEIPSQDLVCSLLPTV